jgi:hypothetical protein
MKTVVMYLNVIIALIVTAYSLGQIDLNGASGVIKFLTGNCLTGLGIVLKEPKAI